MAQLESTIQIDRLLPLMAKGASDACTWLGAKSRTLTPDGAHAYLSAALSRAQILTLYRELFPKEFAASTASTLPFTARPWALNNSDCPLSAREWEFAQLVEEQLFPLDLDMLLEFTHEMEGHFYLIPISPLQYHCWNCADYDPNGLGLAYKLALALMNGDDHLVISYLDQDLTIKKSDSYNCIDRLEEVIAKLSGPIKALPQACRLVTYETGVGWLDWPCEQPTEFYWTKEEIEYLASEYKEAQSVLEEVDEFDAWLAADPARRITQAVQLWNQSVKRKKSKKDESGNQRKRLIEIL